MLYPFTHKVIGHLDIVNYKIKADHNAQLNQHINWVVWPIECQQIQDWVDTCSGLKINFLGLSVGMDIPYHIDRNECLPFSHDILIPVTDNFVWKFKLKDGTEETITPIIGNVYMFNNMIMHSVVATGDDKRMCIMVNVYDERLAETIPSLKKFNGY
jgi:hypothetical protein